MKTSVVLCTYNGEKFLKEQLDSIINQTTKIDEIFISDDCSSDSTLEIVREYQKKADNIILNCNKTNIGYKKNFAFALEQASGDIIFLSDQDDVWAKDKIEKMVALFNKEPQINVVGSNVALINLNSNNIGQLYSKSFAKKFSCLKKQWKEIISYGKIPGMSMAVRKQFLKQCYPIPTTYPHDEWITTIASLNNSIFILEDVLSFYRKHNQQTIGAKRNFKESLKDLSSISESYEKSVELQGQNFISDDYKKLKFVEQKTKLYSFRMRQRKRNPLVAFACVMLNIPMIANYHRFSVSAIKSIVKDIVLKQ